MKPKLNKNPQTNKQYLKDLDIGFRVLKVCDKIEPGVDHERFLYQVFLKTGLLLSSKYEYKKYLDNQYFQVNGNQMYACFDPIISKDFIQFALEDKPRIFCFRSVALDQNYLDGLIKSNSPYTKKEVIYG
jgi:hypothetical protein